ncbi:hypothetical protein RI367_003945 [Sorochytrium milnesiophthora]
MSQANKLLQLLNASAGQAPAPPPVPAPQADVIQPTSKAPAAAAAASSYSQYSQYGQPVAKAPDTNLKSQASPAMPSAAPSPAPAHALDLLLQSAVLGKKRPTAAANLFDLSATQQASPLVPFTPPQQQLNVAQSPQPQVAPPAAHSPKPEHPPAGLALSTSTFSYRNPFDVVSMLEPADNAEPPHPETEDQLLPIADKQDSDKQEDRPQPLTTPLSESAVSLLDALMKDTSPFLSVRPLSPDKFGPRRSSLSADSPTTAFHPQVQALSPDTALAKTEALSETGTSTLSTATAPTAAAASSVLPAFPAFLASPITNAVQSWAGAAAAAGEVDTSASGLTPGGGRAFAKATTEATGRSTLFTTIALSGRNPAFLSQKPLAESPISILSTDVSFTHESGTHRWGMHLFCASEELFAYAMRGGKVRVIHQTSAANALIKLQHIKTGYVSDMAFSRTDNTSVQGRYIAVTAESYLFVYSIESKADKMTAQMVLQIKLTASSGKVWANQAFWTSHHLVVAIQHQNAGHLAVITLQTLEAQDKSSATVITCDMAEQHKIVTLVKAHDQAITALGESKISGYYFTGSAVGEIKLWHGAAPSRQFKIGIDNVTHISTLTVSPSEVNMCVATNNSKQLHIVAVSRQENRAHVLSTIEFTSATFSPPISDVAYDSSANVLLIACYERMSLICVYMSSDSPPSFKALIEHPLSEPILSMAVNQQKKSRDSGDELVRLCSVHPHHVQELEVAIEQLDEQTASDDAIPCTVKPAETIPVVQLSSRTKIKKKEQEQREAGAGSPSAPVQPTSQSQAQPQLQSSKASVAPEATADEAKATGKPKVKKSQAAAAPATPALGLNVSSPPFAPSQPPAVLATAAATSATSGGANNNAAHALPPTQFNTLLNSLTKHIDRQLDNLYARLEKERLERQAMETARQETLLKVVSQTLTNNVSGVLRDVVQAEVTKNVTPAIASAVEKQVNKALRTSVQTLLEQSLPPMIEQNVADSLNRLAQRPVVAEGVAQAISARVVPSVEGAFRTSFQNTLIPAYQNATALMFQQIAKAFEHGLGQAFADERQQLQAVVAQLERTPQDAHHISHAHANGGQAGPSVMPPPLQDDHHHHHHRAPMSPSAALPPKSPASTLPTSQPHFAMGPRAEINTMIQNKQYEAVFTKVLGLSDLALVDHLIANVSPRQVFLSNQTSLVSQPVILSLLHQLSLDFSQNLDNKLSWLQEALVALDAKDPAIREHCLKFLPVISHRIETQYNKLLAEQPSDPHIKALKLLMHVLHSVLV